jgi:hypothetical protein
MCTFLFACGALLAGLSACRPDAPAERLPTVPFLEAVPAGYRPAERTDTLPSYWAPPEAYVNNTFDFTPAHRSEVQLQIRLVPASATHGLEFDTFTFHLVRSRYGVGGEGIS